MWLICPECNISGGCDCHVTKRQPPVRDHKKEHEAWEQEVLRDALFEIEEEKRIKQLMECI